MLSKEKCLIGLLIGVFATAMIVDAAPRRLSDLGGSSSLMDKRFSTGESSSPRGDKMFGNDRIKFDEWHGNYSSIGEKRFDALQQRGGKQFSTSEIEYEGFERTEARISLDSDERKLANVQNWNTVRDNVMSHKFSNTELQTPDARKFSEMVDEVSLQDINRFQFMKNKTDAGIPVQTAGSGSGTQLSSEQQRVMARIGGRSEESVGTYEEQGTTSIRDLGGSDSAEEPSFFERLFGN